MRVVPRKSGASAPRNPAESPRASAPVLVLARPIKSFSLSSPAAALPPPTWFQNGKPDGPPSQFRNSRLLYHMWKTSPQTCTKPVIAGDTTYGVSLLTGTIYGSNFAIPDNKFRLTGMGRNLHVSRKRREWSGKNVSGRQARGDLASITEGLKRRPSLRPSGPVSFSPEAGSRMPGACGGRSPILPRGTTTH
jgi:hypothetical protein